MRKDGSTVPVEVSVTPLQPEDGSYRESVSLITGITDRLEPEMQLAGAQQMEAIGPDVGHVFADRNSSRCS